MRIACSAEREVNMNLMADTNAEHQVIGLVTHSVIRRQKIERHDVVGSISFVRTVQS
jgi:hypothetical protein